MTAKKPSIDPANAAAWASGGRNHRPEHQKTKAQNEAQSQIEQGGESRTGRPKAFDKSDRLNLLLPAHMVEAIKIRALKEKKTPGQLVAELLESTFPQQH